MDSTVPKPALQPAARPPAQPAAVDRRGASRARLVDAALELFARQGFDATSVGEIEAEAGFAPRSGALYQYFDSKRALLDAGLEQHLASVGDVGEQLELRPLADVRSEITLLAHWLLAELDRERQITHLLEREGERLADLRERARVGISERGYRIGSDLLKRWLPGTTATERDVFAVTAIGALVNFRRSTWTYGAPPRNLSDENFITGWVDLFHAHLHQHPHVHPNLHSHLHPHLDPDIHVDTDET